MTFSFQIVVFCFLFQLIRQLLHIILLLSALLSFSQSPVTIHLTDKDGLPDYEIYDILEDSKGYVWIAANKGLFRYDGKVFTLFTIPEKRGLSVFGLIQDNKGRIWCNNISGQFFYVEKDKMKLFVDLKDQINGKLSEFKILHNELIALTENGIYKQKIDSSKGKFLKDNEVSSVYYHSPFLINNQFYFIHANKVRKLEKDIFDDGLFIDFQEKEINKFCYQELDNKILYFFSDSKSHLYELKNKKHVPVYLKEIEKTNINKLLTGIFIP